MSKRFKFHEIPEDKKTECKSYYSLMMDLIAFQNKATLKLFIYLFAGKGNHLFEKFYALHNRDILSFMNSSDLGVRDVIITNIVMHKGAISDVNYLYTYA